MKDNLEDFVKGHRAEFDTREPNEQTWSRIETGMGTAKWYASMPFWRAAALVLLSTSIYLLLNSYYDGRRFQREFSDLEGFYSSEIAKKVALIDDLEGVSDDDQFTQDVQKLDAMYEVLREEMRVRPSEKVKDALILNLLVRIDLLNQQISRLEKKRSISHEEES